MKDKLCVDIKALRKSKGLRQDYLARACGISAPALCRYENGSRAVPISVAKKIAKELDINWSMMFDSDRKKRSVCYDVVLPIVEAYIEDWNDGGMCYRAICPHCGYEHHTDQGTANKGWWTMKGKAIVTHCEMCPNEFVVLPVMRRFKAKDENVL